MFKSVGWAKRSVPTIENIAEDGGHGARAPLHTLRSQRSREMESKLVIDPDRRRLDVQLHGRGCHREAAGGDEGALVERAKTHVVVFGLHRPIAPERPFDAGAGEPSGAIESADRGAGDRAYQIGVEFVAGERGAA